jgi:hypothetical protein
MFLAGVLSITTLLAYSAARRSRRAKPLGSDQTAADCAQRHAIAKATGILQPTTMAEGTYMNAACSSRFILMDDDRCPDANWADAAKAQDLPAKRCWR